MESGRLALLKQVAAGIAAEFGSSCEVVVHDLSRHPDHTIVAIENGHVSGRKVGDGASYVVLEQLQTQDQSPRDQLGYLTKTPDGKILKSSTLYIRNSRGKVCAILAINHDISPLLMAEGALRELTATAQPAAAEPEKIIKINELLDDLIAQSVALVGKPAAVMNREEKIRALRFLDENGAFLVSKSSEKVRRYFGISKYTLYAYLEGREAKDSSAREHPRPRRRSSGKTDDKGACQDD